jgi:hypothetical protein
MLSNDSAENRSLHERRYGLCLEVVAIGDSTGYVAHGSDQPLADQAILVSKVSLPDCINLSFAAGRHWFQGIRKEAS